MITRNRRFVLLAMAAIFAAIGGLMAMSGGGEAVTLASDNDNAVEATAEASGDAEIVLEDDIERPEWQLIELTDARTGETFTLGDFYGRTVFVEPMATWCVTCRSQMRNIVSLIAELEEEEAEREANDETVADVDDAPRTTFDLDEVVFIGLSVETNLNPERLAEYVDAQGFDWTFAIIPSDMLSLLVDEFGRPILNPPSTPKFFVRADGTYSELFTGVRSSDQLHDDILQAILESAPTLLIEDDETEADEADDDESDDDEADTADEV